MSAKRIGLLDEIDRYVQVYACWLRGQATDRAYLAARRRLERIVAAVEAR